jgi:hypothetical protein
VGWNQSLKEAVYISRAGRVLANYPGMRPSGTFPSFLNKQVLSEL